MVFINLYNSNQKLKNNGIFFLNNRKNLFFLFFIALQSATYFLSKAEEIKNQGTQNLNWEKHVYNLFKFLIR